MPHLRKIAIKLNVIDRPNQIHKTHAEPVPYLGGFSIVIPITVFCVFGGFLVNGIENHLKIIVFLLPSLIMAAVGFVDDFINLPPKPRFIVQLATSVTVSIVLFQSGFASQITGLPILDFFISVTWLVGLTNAFNFIDNLDGGAAGVSIIAAFSIFLLGWMSDQYLIATLAISVAGATAGFIFWNINPARIYLGDGGALFLGIVFGILLLQLEPEAIDGFTSSAIPILILAVPIIDTSVVVISRTLRGISVLQGGRDHLSHRIQKIGFSRKYTASLLWLMSLTFSALAVMINYFDGVIEFYLALVGLGMCVMAVIIFLFLSHD